MNVVSTRVDYPTDYQKEYDGQQPSRRATVHSAQEPRSTQFPRSKMTTGVGSASLFLLIAISCCNSFNPVAKPTRGLPNCIGRTRPVRSGQSPVVVVRDTSKEDLGEAKDKKTKKRRKNKRSVEYEHRRKLWLERYGSLQALQSTFGTGKALTPSQTRRLYHTLLPRSLLGLKEMDLMHPEELAQLAYEARIAAKLYARSRTVWYSKLATVFVDQYRNLRKRGRLSSQSSLSWEEIWSKYEAQILEEECTAERKNNGSAGLHKNTKKQPIKSKGLTEKELSMRVYLRILERSCVTNQAFDEMFLKQHAADELDIQLSQMAKQLDQDVREILLREKDSAKVAKREKAQLKKEARKSKQQEKELERRIKTERKRQRKDEKYTEKQQ